MGLFGQTPTPRRFVLFARAVAAYLVEETSWAQVARSEGGSVFFTPKPTRKVSAPEERRIDFGFDDDGCVFVPDRWLDFEDDIPCVSVESIGDINAMLLRFM